MSIIRDVVEVFKDISDYDEVEIFKNKPKGSLTRMTKDAVLQFPVIASNSLDIQLIGLVNKALERNFTTLLKIAFSLNSITDEKDLVDYIRQFHQNTGLSDREYTSNLIVDKLVNECKIEYRFTDETLTESDKALIMHTLTKDNHRLLREYLSELNLDKLNDKMIFINEAKYKHIGNSLEDLAKIKDQFPKSSPTSSSSSKTSRSSQSSSGPGSGRTGGGGGNNGDGGNGGNRRFPFFTINNTPSVSIPRPTVDIKNNTPVNVKNSTPIKNFNNMITKPNITINVPKQDNPAPKKFVMGGKAGAAFTTADVTKANEIMPLPLEVKVYIEDDKGHVIERDFMIGVKAVIHPVSSEYMIDSMMDGYRRGKFFFNFIKATTGEIKFFRDFVFMVDNIKTDAIKNASGTNNKWFSFLKRRALLAKFKNTLRMKHQLLPNTSIVLSGEEADTLKQQGVDILDPRVARDIISHYFLLSIVVIDPALEIVHIIYDGEEQYSSMSVMALNREAKEDKDTKQILSLLKSRPQF